MTTFSWLYILERGSVIFRGSWQLKVWKILAQTSHLSEFFWDHTVAWSCRQNFHLWLNYLFNQFPLYRQIFWVSKCWAPPLNSVFTSFSLCCSIASPPSIYFPACAWWASEVGTCLGMHKTIWLIHQHSLMKTTEHDPNSLTVWSLILYSLGMMRWQLFLSEKTVPH